MKNFLQISAENKSARIKIIVARNKETNKPAFICAICGKKDKRKREEKKDKV